MDMSELEDLQAWTLAQCDGDWEHGHGVLIQTLDNPGWRVSINLAGTEAAGRSFEELKDNYEHDTDWMRCWLEDDTFQAACGSLRLTRVIRVFLEWAAPSNPHCAQYKAPKSPSLKSFSKLLNGKIKSILFYDK